MSLTVSAVNSFVSLPHQQDPHHHYSSTSSTTTTINNNNNNSSMDKTFLTKKWLLDSQRRFRSSSHSTVLSATPAANMFQRAAAAAAIRQAAAAEDEDEEEDSYSECGGNEEEEEEEEETLAAGDMVLLIPAPGTTFPPQAHILHAFRERLLQMGQRHTCYSEPDLSHQIYEDESPEMEDVDDDHLFEFDMEDDALSNDEEITTDPLESKLVSGPINSDARRRYSFSSSDGGPATSTTNIIINSSSSSNSSSCPHSQLRLLPTADEDDVVVGVGSGTGSDRAGSHSFLSSVFGSRSSGIGSERRSSQETFGDLEGLSVEPENWRDYMNDRLSSDGTCTPDFPRRISDGTATPILAVSPSPAPQPLISPDSLLDSDHHLEDQQLFTNLCLECEISSMANNTSSKCTSQASPPAGDISPPDGDCSTSRTVEEPVLCPPVEKEGTLTFPVSAPSPCQESVTTETAVTEVNSCWRNSNNTINTTTFTTSSTSDNTDSSIPNTKAESAENPAEGIASPCSETSVDEAAAAVCSEPTRQKEGDETEVEKFVSGLEKLKLELLLQQLEKEKDYPTVCVRKPSEEDSQLPATASDETAGSETLSVVSEQEEENLSDTSSEMSEDARPKLRKCSSLKSGRTPPGTPGVRKFVRFADIFGLDLQEVKTFTDEIPRIPRKAFQDLNVDLSEFDVGSPRLSAPIHRLTGATFSQQCQPLRPLSTTSLVPMFVQPGAQHNFFNIVNQRKVCLENAFMESSTVITGVVRVLNIDFHKSVVIRWTINDWSTYNDLPASYVQNSGDGFSDKFSFRLCLGSLPVGSRIQFCLKYACSGTEFWDNNDNGNYVFQVFLSSSTAAVGVPTTTSPSTIPFHRSSPVSLPARPTSLPTAYHQSPSTHGDDPWMRFM